MSDEVSQAFEVSSLISDILLPCLVSFLTAVMTGKLQIRLAEKRKCKDSIDQLIANAEVHFRSKPDKNSQAAAIRLGAAVSQVEAQVCELVKASDRRSQTIAEFRMAITQDAEDSKRAPLAEGNIRLHTMKEKAMALKKLF